MTSATTLFHTALQFGVAAPPPNYGQLSRQERDRAALEWLTELNDREQAGDAAAVNLCKGFPEFRRRNWAPRPATAHTLPSLAGTPAGWPSPVEQMESFLASCPPLPSTLQGRGIVTSAGGDRPGYLLNAYVQFRLLRHLGCDLPVDCYYLGEREHNDAFARFVEPLGVTMIDAVAAGYVGHPIPSAVVFQGNGHPYAPEQLHGYSLKPFAVSVSRFAEVIWLDADAHPVIDPAAMFASPEYQQTGALFWPDNVSATNHYPRLDAFGLMTPAGQENGLETGQIVLDKRRHWPAVQLANWIGATAQHWYQFIFGDKDAFLAAWLKAKSPYWTAQPLTLFEGLCFLQHAPGGDPAVLHRAGPSSKLPLIGPDPLTNVPHRAVVDAAVAEFRLWYMSGGGIPHRPTVLARERLGEVTAKLPAHSRDATTLDVLGEVLLDNCYRLPESMAGEVVVDVGGHVGAFALTCLERGAERVVTIEPDPANYGFLLANLREHLGERLLPWNVAAWTEAGLLPFRRRQGAMHSAGGSVVVDVGEVQVPAISLDQIVTACCGDRKDLGLKLDCEGAERYLLMQCDLSRYRWIIGEWHYGGEDRRRGPTPEQCWERLRRSGFTVEVDTHPHIDAGIGMFWARR